MLAQIERILLPTLLIAHPLRSVDLARTPEVSEAVNRNAWCVRTLGYPAALAVGLQKSLGVFIWSSRSRISIAYRGLGDEHGLGENETAITAIRDDNDSATER